MFNPFMLENTYKEELVRYIPYQTSSTNVYQLCSSVLFLIL